QPIAGPYDLNVSTQGLTASTRCPQSLKTAQPSGAQGVRLGCSEDYFQIAVTRGLDGLSKYGDHAADADPIEFRVQVTPLADAAAPGSAELAPAAASSGSVQVHITSTFQPNGPECVPTCRSRGGHVTLSP